MKLCSGILNKECVKADKEHFEFYDSLVLTVDIAFQCNYFRTTPTGIPQIYIPDVINDDDDE
jgi:hypothetical protein